MHFRKSGLMLALALSLCATMGWAQPAAGAAKRTDTNEVEIKVEKKTLPPEKLEWFRDAKFGLFIHWGLYAVPAGTWKGEKINGIGEWIMNRAKIPVEEYEQLAKQFDPKHFDADAIVKMAHDAGMKYLVITSKHHDGFAMYDSPVSKYDVVDATPWHHDPMKDLAKACKKYGLKMCFYYSQSQDWHEPNGLGNTWDFGPDDKKNFDQYMNDKVFPQVREILTQYGPIGLIWFDTPKTITPEQSKKFYDLVHELQPDCLVCSRVGNGYGDYRDMGDNQIPKMLIEEPWETPATINDTWGFKSYDDKFKSVETLQHYLVDITSKGGNYLLNVGPTADGVVPQPEVERLAAIGKWMKKNSESIHGTRATDFKRPAWGRTTNKPGKLYLHVFDWPKDGKLVLDGMTNEVSSARILEGKKMLGIFPRGKKLKATVENDVLTVNVPKTAPDKLDTVIVVNYKGDLKVNTHPVKQAADGTITLLSGDSYVETNNNKEALTWDADVTKPGKYSVVATYSTRRTGGPVAFVVNGGQAVKAELAVTGQYDKFQTDTLGTVDLKEGKAKLAIQAGQGRALPTADFEKIELTVAK